ncbi:hypothetical protein BDY17DRAFT_329322 [Neohortaea acidophila]|uniref:Uncharacterized protein n=1 Tax=Neohortaea acidophila TaxID=245834 RepID=A0A6A6Q5S9_9PEZI|nr:uncharacterized protein BDY17DRAFT_329322 [Neohortaea acidophila]KAF2487675.1 hypothetical protein BDY17DRAFT_329322 [Neohortaea acidophila]
MAERSRVYVAPTAKSLASLQKITNDAKAASKITELVFLAEILDSKRMNALTEREYMVVCEDAVADGKIQLPSDFECNTASLKASWQRYRDVVAEHQVQRDGTKETLKTCLLKLVSLHTVRVQNKIDSPGLNEDPFYLAPARDVHKSPDGGTRLAFRFASDRNLVMNGVNHLFEALAECEKPIKTLNIGNGLSDQAEYGINGVGCYSAFPPLRQLAPKLTHLTLSAKDCDTGRYYERTASGEWREFFRAACNLQYLRIYPELMQDGTIWRSNEHGTVLGLVLAHHTFPHLHTFKVIGFWTRPTNVRAVWLNAFLRRHQDSIRHLELSGVLVVNWYSSKGTAATMAKSIRMMKSTLSLQTATMI